MSVSGDSDIDLEDLSEDESNEVELLDITRSIHSRPFQFQDILSCCKQMPKLQGFFRDYMELFFDFETENDGYVKCIDCSVEINYEKVTSLTRHAEFCKGSEAEAWRREIYDYKNSEYCDLSILWNSPADAQILERFNYFTIQCPLCHMTFLNLRQHFKNEERSIFCTHFGNHCPVVIEARKNLISDEKPGRIMKEFAIPDEFAHKMNSGQKSACVYIQRDRLAISQSFSEFLGGFSKVGVAYFIEKAKDAYRGKMSRYRNNCHYFPAFNSSTPIAYGTEEMCKKMEAVDIVLLKKSLENASNELQQVMFMNAAEFNAISNSTKEILWKFYNYDVITKEDLDFGPSSPKKPKILVSNFVNTITLHVQSEKIGVPKKLFKDNAKLFEKIFKDGELAAVRSGRKSTGTVIFKDVKPEIMQAIIQHLDGEEIEDLNEIAVELFIAADKYTITELKDECFETIEETIDNDSFSNCLQLAFAHDNENLKQFSMDYISNADNEVSADIFTALDGINTQMSETLVQFAQNGLIENSDLINFELYVIASKYGFLELKEMCLESIVKGLDDNNLLELLTFAFTNKDDLLKKHVLNFILKNGGGTFVELLASVKWIEFASRNHKLASEIILLISRELNIIR